MLEYCIRVCVCVCVCERERHINNSYIHTTFVTQPLSIQLSVAFSSTTFFPGLLFSSLSLQFCLPFLLLFLLFPLLGLQPIKMCSILVAGYYPGL